MNVRIWAAGCALLIIVEAPVFAAINKWSAMGPEGGTISKIAFSKAPNTLFVIAGPAVYRSLDGGMTWAAIASNFLNTPSDLATDPSDSTRLYVTSIDSPALLVSTDGGSTVVALASLPTVIRSATQIVVSQDGATLYLSMSGRIFASVDRGQSWQERTALSSDPSAFISKMVLDPTDAKTLLAVVRSATGIQTLSSSRDGAVSWQPLSTSVAPAVLTVRDLAINPANAAQYWSAQNDGIWLSPDRGAHWSNINPAPTAGLAIDPVNPSIVYAAGVDGTMLSTTDGGGHWTDVSGNLRAGQNPTVAVNPSTDSQVFAGGRTTLAMTSVAGNTWTIRQTGIVAATVSTFSADASVDRVYSYVPMAGVYFAAAGASSATAVNNDALLNLLAGPTDFINSIVAQSGILSASLGLGVAQSRDGGATWAMSYIDATGGSEQLYSMVAPTGTQTILAASETTLYKSPDGGGSWSTISAGVPNDATVSVLLAAPSNPTVAYATFISTVNSGSVAQLGLFRSADAGSTWALSSSSATTLSTRMLAVDPTNANILYGSSASALLKSIDAGVSWAPLTWDASAAFGYPNTLAVDPLHPGILYAASTVSLERSVDGGATWQIIRSATAIPTWVYSTIIADPKRPENILVSVDGRGAQVLTIAPDLALTFHPPSNPFALGVPASMTFTVTNLGPFDATGVKTNLQLPPTLTHMSASVDGGSCTVSAGNVACTVDILRAAATANITVSATPPTAGKIPVSGAVQGDQPDASPSNNTLKTSLSAAVVADLSVSLSASSSAKVGDALTVTLTAKNAGPNTAPAPHVTFNLASGLTPGAVTSSGATCTQSGAATACVLADMPISTSVAITMNAKATTAGNQISTAAINSSATDLVSMNNNASISTSVTPASASGGGGGGAVSELELLALAMLIANQVRARRCFRRGNQVDR
jgi:uncharacterized repeat protein (TIGR01451 family)